MTEGRTTSFKKYDDPQKDLTKQGSNTFKDTTNKGNTELATQASMAAGKYGAMQKEKQQLYSPPKNVTNGPVLNRQEQQKAEREEKAEQDNEAQQQAKQEKEAAGAEAADRAKQLKETKESGSGEQTLPTDRDGNDKSQKEQADKDQKAKDDALAQAQAQEEQARAERQAKWDGMKRSDTLKRAMVGGLSAAGNVGGNALDAIGSMIKMVDGLVLGNPLSSPTAGMRAMVDMTVDVMNAVQGAENNLGEIWGVKDGKSTDLAGTIKGAKYFEEKMALEESMSKVNNVMSKAMIEAFGPDAKASDFAQKVSDAITNQDTVTLGKMEKVFIDELKSPEMQDIQAKIGVYDAETNAGVPMAQRHRPSQAEMLRYNTVKNIVDRTFGNAARNIERQANANAALSRHKRAELMHTVYEGRAGRKEATQALLREYASSDDPMDNMRAAAYDVLGHFPTSENTAKLIEEYRNGGPADGPLGNITLSHSDASRILNLTNEGDTSPAIRGLRQMAEKALDRDDGDLPVDFYDGEFYTKFEQMNPSSAKMKAGDFYLEDSTRGTKYNEHLGYFAYKRADHILKGYEDDALKNNATPAQAKAQAEEMALADKDYVNYMMLSRCAYARAYVGDYNTIFSEDKISRLSRKMKKLGYTDRDIQNVSQASRDVLISGQTMYENIDRMRKECNAKLEKGGAINKNDRNYIKRRIEKANSTMQKFIDNNKRFADMVS